MKRCRSRSSQANPGPVMNQASLSQSNPGPVRATPGARPIEASQRPDQPGAPAAYPTPAVTRLPAPSRPAHTPASPTSSVALTLLACLPQTCLTPPRPMLPRLGPDIYEGISVHSMPCLVRLPRDPAPAAG